MFVLSYGFKVIVVGTLLAVLGPVLRQDIMANSKWRAKLFTQWQLGSWGLREQRQVMLFKDLSPVT